MVWFNIHKLLENEKKPTTFSAKFERSSFPPGTKILRPRISLRVKATDIENKYDFCYITCAYGSSMLRRVDLIVS